MTGPMHMHEAMKLHGLTVEVSGHAQDASPAGPSISVLSLFFDHARWKVFMATPQQIIDDLAALDQDATAATNAATQKTATAAALAQAGTDDSAAASALAAAQSTQATQLAKTIADLQAQYGPPPAV